MILKKKQFQPHPPGPKHMGGSGLVLGAQCISTLPSYISVIPYTFGRCVPIIQTSSSISGHVSIVQTPKIPYSTYRNSLSNSLSRIFNAYQRSFEEESIPFSLINIQLISSFTNAGYVSGWNTYTDTNLRYEASNQDPDACLSSDFHDRDASAFIRIYLKYYQGRPAIRGLSQISKPGKRIFVSKKKLLKISEAGSWGNNKTLFVGTPQGVMTHREILSGSSTRNAKHTGTSEGGEAYCLVW